MNGFKEKKEEARVKLLQVIVMDKNAVKNFAAWAGKSLVEQVAYKAYELGITKDNIVDLDDADSKRDRLVRKIKEEGFEKVIDEVSCTWFNRIAALRFMEVNGYLPSGIRVLSSKDGPSGQPDIIKHALTAELDCDSEKIIKYREENEINKLYRNLLIAQCKNLSKILPSMFESVDDYIELLLPDNLLNEGSVIRRLVEDIPGEEFKEVEILGWLYQFYILEKKDEVFSLIKKNVKIAKENIPAATQLFTPKWIVKYLVENSVGRLWLEGSKCEELKSSWKYYIKESDQDAEVRAGLEKIREDRKNISSKDIKVLDPACGSGHMLVYAFDVLYDIYLKEGYNKKDIPKYIIEKNLYGLDIDDRAANLASFAVVMKGREKDEGFLRRIEYEGVKINIASIAEANSIGEAVDAMVDGADDAVYAKEQADKLIETFYDAKEYGSIINVDHLDIDYWEDRLRYLNSTERTQTDGGMEKEARKVLTQIIKAAGIMSMKYDAVVTNPPYMGYNSMNRKLASYLKRQYPLTKGDLSTVFMEASLKFLNRWGYMSMINIPSWMFLSSYLKLRRDIIHRNTFISMLHLGRGVFGADFGTTAFVICRAHIKNYKGHYRKLFDAQGEVESIEQKEKNFFENTGDYYCSQESFKEIPGMPIAYWASQRMRKIFATANPLKSICDVKVGLQTSDNNRFLRLWYEVDVNTIGLGFNDRNEARASNMKWFPYNKGGEYRKWYGNNEYVVNWHNDGEEIKNYVAGRYPYLNGRYEFVVKNQEFYFKEGITWSFLSSSKFGVRYTPKGYIFDVAGSSVFPETEKLYYILGLLCSNTAFEFLKILNPTLNFQAGNIGNLPYMEGGEEQKQRIGHLVSRNIIISRDDWDTLETSLDFSGHPLLKYKDSGSTIEKAYNNWAAYRKEKLKELKSNEEEINRIFIDIYGLDHELDPEVEDKDVTVLRPNPGRDIRSFVSYAVGCMMGRYSLDYEGIAFAGGEFDSAKYKTFKADMDGIIPILADEYFENDIVSRLVKFIEVVFGKKNIKGNLDFIACVLGCREGEAAVDAIRRYFLNDFYKDHVRMYRKRPIYWLITSGNEKGFNALMYMHRYEKNTVSKIRTHYLHELQNRMYSERYRIRSMLEAQVLSDKEKRKIDMKLAVIDRQMEEIIKYDELLCHYAELPIDMDLDIGVSENYKKFKDLLAGI